MNSKSDKTRPAHQSLPRIAPEERASFAKRLQSIGMNERDAENAAWILSLSDQQRLELIIKVERERKYLGIALDSESGFPLPRE